jgi:hypothetical protein
MADDPPAISRLRAAPEVTKSQVRAPSVEHMDLEGSGQMQHLVISRTISSLRFE